MHGDPLLNAARDAAHVFYFPEMTAEKPVTPYAKTLLNGHRLLHVDASCVSRGRRVRASHPIPSGSAIDTPRAPRRRSIASIFGAHTAGVPARSEQWRAS